MTTNDESGNGKPEKGKSQRPHMTLDVKATDVTPEAASVVKTPEGGVSGGADASDRKQESDAFAANAANAGASNNTPPVDVAGNDVGVQSFMTHMAAGVLGGLFALVIGYYVAGGLRDRLPMLTERSAQDFQAALAKQEERLAALDKAVHAPRADNTQADTRLKALSDQANSLKQEIAALSKRMDDRLAAIASKPAPALTPAPAPVAPPGVSPEAMQQSLNPLRAKLTELEGRLSQVARDQAVVQTDSKASALAVALYNLRRAVNEGKPFAAELQTIASMTPVPLDLAPLEAVREKGVRNLAQLRKSFSASVDAAIETENRPADKSFSSRLWASLKSVVRIRRVGEVPGNTTQAILARAEVRLKNGDLKAVLKEIAQLKGDAANAFKAWQNDAQSRIAVDETLSRVEASLLAALGRTDNAKRDG
ncbi:MAG: mitofilin family membrane protein [Alphaproteobacteria bacterium]